MWLRDEFDPKIPFSVGTCQVRGSPLASTLLRTNRLSAKNLGFNRCRNYDALCEERPTRLFVRQEMQEGNMAKRRTASKRRAKKVPKRRPNKVMSFHQAARRKRSQPQRDQLELEPDSLKDSTKGLSFRGTFRERIY